MAEVSRKQARSRRHLRVRKKVFGTAVRPRLCVFRSAHHMYAQVIDDTRGVTLAASCTVRGKESSAERLSKTKNAERVGSRIAELCKAAEVSRVVFDRGGYPYHGRVKALAEAARAAGLSF